jgi:hypothetical protein
MADIDPFADDTPHREAFNQKPYDAEKARAPLLKRIDKALERFNSSSPSKATSWMRTENGHYEFKLPFAIKGRDTWYRPAETFAAVLEKLKEQIAAGTHDDDIKAANAADPAMAATSTTTRKARAPRASSGEGGSGWSPQRREKFLATVAARKAAQGSDTK